MEYSASLVSCLFWLSETRKTAEYMLQKKTKDEIKQIAVDDNIYQVRARERSTRIFGVTYKRLELLPKELVEAIAKADISTAKIIVLISIMKTDRLFFEFMHEIYRGNIILGDMTIKDRDLNQFFNEKVLQSKEVAGFSESAIKKLKQCYTRMLFEAGLLSQGIGDKQIKKVAIDYRIIKQFEDAGLGVYLNAITGEK